MNYNKAKILKRIKSIMNANKHDIREKFSISRITLIDNLVDISSDNNNVYVRINVIVEFSQRKSLLELIRTEVALFNLLKMKVDILRKETLEHYLMNSEINKGFTMQGILEYKLNFFEIRKYAI